MLKAKFGKDYIRKELAKQRQAILSDLVMVTARVGEKFISDARNSLRIDTGAFPHGDYTDRTGNLRSSIGYAVLVDSEVIVSKIPENNEGRAAFINIIASLPYARGLVFVGMAGMEYASYLEAMGYNVISSQWDVATVDLSNDLKRFEASAMKRLSGFESRIFKGL